MPIVKTSQCPTAAQLTEVRREKVVLLFAGGRNKDRHTSRVSLKAVFPGELPGSLRTGV